MSMRPTCTVTIGTARRTSARRSRGVGAKSRNIREEYPKPTAGASAPRRPRRLGATQFPAPIRRYPRGKAPCPCRLQAPRGSRASLGEAQMTVPVERTGSADPEVRDPVDPAVVQEVAAWVGQLA